MRKTCKIILGKGFCDALAVDSIPMVHNECDGEFKCSVYGCGELPMCAEHWDEYIKQRESFHE